jgi:hypothetical protein
MPRGDTAEIYVWTIVRNRKIKKEERKMSNQKLKRRLYLAYGSKMNVSQMARRCPTAKVIGHTMLENWCLVFNGVATIKRSRGCKVPVVVWEIQPRDEMALDVYEGYPRLYRKEMRRIKLNGISEMAMVYIMNHGYPSPPSDVYFNSILEGYNCAKFDTEILYTAAKKLR